MEPARNPKVDAFLARQEQWRAEFEALRSVALSFELTEELKWGHPCYTLEGKNVVLMHGFKEYCALLFMKGALLTDADAVLVQQTQNVQSARQIRFTSLGEIERMDNVLKAFVHEAINIERSRAKVEKKRTEDFPVAPEFQQMLEARSELRSAFSALTPGRQRGYLLHFAAAKQAATRKARVEKCVDKILAGKGLDD